MRMAVTQQQVPLLPSYLDVGQQLLLSPPDVLQFLTLLCSQVTGNYKKRGTCYEQSFFSPKISKLLRPQKDKDTTEEAGSPFWK